MTTSCGCEALGAEVAQLRIDVAAMRRQLAAEVPTRRLVVVDEWGREGVVAETFVGGVSIVEVRTAFENGDDAIALRLRAADDGDGAPYVEVVAYEGDGLRAPHDVIVRASRGTAVPPRP